MAIALGSSRRQSKAGDKRALELSRWFGSPSTHNNYQHHHHHRQQQQQHHQKASDEDSVIEWTSHAWTFDELLRLYAKKLPVIVKSTRGYYGRPGDMQLDVGQVWHIAICLIIA